MKIRAPNYYTVCPHLRSFVNQYLSVCISKRVRKTIGIIYCYSSYNLSLFGHNGVNLNSARR